MPRFDISRVIFQNKVCPFFVRWHEARSATLRTDILYSQILRENVMGASPDGPVLSDPQAAFASGILELMCSYSHRMWRSRATRSGTIIGLISIATRNSRGCTPILTKSKDHWPLSGLVMLFRHLYGGQIGDPPHAPRLWEVDPVSPDEHFLKHDIQRTAYFDMHDIQSDKATMDIENRGFFDPIEHPGRDPICIIHPNRPSAKFPR